jgi:mRNA interferase MazF
MEIKQYEIVMLNLDPTIGSEMKKNRPCVVISPDEMNKHLQTIVIAPLTISSKSYPTRIEIKQSKIKGWIVIDQIRTVDRSRVFKQMGHLTIPEIALVKNVILETYVE